MRNRVMEIELTSNLDLTQFSNRRLCFEKLDEEFYLATSPLRFYRGEADTFIYNFLKRHAQIVAVCGNCSRPDGYIFACEKFRTYAEWLAQRSTLPTAS